MSWTGVAVVEADSSLLIFMEPKLGLPFALMLLAGLSLVAAWRLLRAWPPRRSRVLMLMAVLAFCAGAAGFLLRERWVQIDFERQLVTQRMQVLGMGSQTRWTFAQIDAVVVRTRPEPDPKPGPRPDPAVRNAPVFMLGFQMDQAWVALREFPDAFAAEQQARQVAQRMQRPARRVGYRIQTAAHGGAARAFETTNGQSGVGIHLESVLQVVTAPQHESVIEP
ncbi:MAG: hypothetical protein ACT4PG_13070 [Panacagrimonas sp.]